jgi:SAM-dependent methyltransferase
LSLFYKLLYQVGFMPWERMPTLPVARQVSALLDREQAAREPLYGAALDLGCGGGLWSIELARRGWEVTGVDIVPKALSTARARIRKAGVEVRLVQADVTALRAAGVGSGFRLVLDFGTVHGLSPAQRETAGQEVSAIVADDATLLMYATKPGHRGPLPRGASRAEIEAAYPGWRVIDEEPFDSSGLPAAFKRAEPRWYRLRLE